MDETMDIRLGCLRHHKYFSPYCTMDEPWILDLDASGIINIFHLTALWLKPWILDLIAFAAVRSFIHPTDPTAEAGQALQRGRSEPLDRCAFVPLYLFIHPPDPLERGRLVAE